MAGKYHRSLKRKLMLFSQKGPKPCRKSPRQVRVERFDPQALRRSVNQDEMRQDSSQEHATPETDNTPMGGSPDDSLTRKFNDEHL